MASGSGDQQVLRRRDSTGLHPAIMHLLFWAAITQKNVATRGSSLLAYSLPMKPMWENSSMPHGCPSGGWQQCKKIASSRQVYIIQRLGAMPWHCLRADYGHAIQLQLNHSGPLRELAQLR